MQRPQLEILICTVEPRLSGAERVLLPPMDGVAYLVSCQYATAEPPVPEALQRPDVRVVFLQGRGLSRNRNHALSQSAGEFLLLCDDDEQLVPASLVSLVALSRERRWQMVQLQADGLNKQYPADYVSSVELLLSREVGQRIRFDERFGLG
ncbi:MAG: glycosyltransferase, partial [Bacteroidaceae bacterium]|nr:glycosyltransferase [Bacteroidaceae bacterium]